MIFAGRCCYAAQEQASEPVYSQPELRAGTIAHWLHCERRRVAAAIACFPGILVAVQARTPPRVITTRELASDPENEYGFRHVIRVEFADGRPAEIWPGELNERDLAAREFPAGTQIFTSAAQHHAWFKFR